MNDATKTPQEACAALRHLLLMISRVEAAQVEARAAERFATVGGVVDFSGLIEDLRGRLCREMGEVVGLMFKRGELDFLQAVESQDIQLPYAGWPTFALHGHAPRGVASNKPPSGDEGPDEPPPVKPSGKRSFTEELTQAFTEHHTAPALAAWLVKEWAVQSSRSEYRLTIFGATIEFDGETWCMSGNPTVYGLDLALELAERRGGEG